MEWLIIGALVVLGLVAASKSGAITIGAGGISLSGAQGSLPQAPALGAVGTAGTGIPTAFPAAFYRPPVATGPLVGKVGGITATAAGAGTAAAASATLLGLSAVAWTGIGAVVAGVALLARLIFRGADPNQVPASKIEQTYEAAADMIFGLFNHHLIDKSVAVNLMNGMIQGMSQAEQEAPQYQRDPRPFRNAIQNSQKSIMPMINQAMMTLDVKPSVRLTLAAAHNAYPPFDTRPGHWYPESVDMGRRIADGAVNYLIQSDYNKDLPLAS